MRTGVKVTETENTEKYAGGMGAAREAPESSYILVISEIYPEIYPKNFIFHQKLDGIRLTYSHCSHAILFKFYYPWSNTVAVILNLIFTFRFFY